MNYLRPVAVNIQQKINAETDTFKNCSVKANPEKGLSSVGRGILTRFLIMSCFAIAIMPKNSMASGYDLLSPSLFCEHECSEFFSIPAAVGFCVGGLAGVPVGMGAGVPVAIGMGTAYAVSGHKPGEILRVASSGLWLSSFVAAAVGAQVIGNVVAFPFWVTEKLVYDAPLKVVSIVRSHF
jgi:hypothetical protein